MLANGALVQSALADIVATAGTVFNDSVTEAATASATETALAAYAATLTETATAAEAESVIATFTASDAEAGTATDTPSAVATYPVSVSESASAIDATSADDVDAASIIESANASDSVDGPVDEGIRGGEGIVGGTFSRGRWRGILEAEEEARKARLKAKRLKKQEHRELAIAAAEQARQAVLAARQAQQEDWAEQEQIRRLTAALAGFNSAQTIQDTMRHSQAMAQAAQAHHAHMMAQDEDEAISLLMLHG